jgi:hypothetical protein
MQELPRRMVEGRTTHQCIMVRLVSLGETGAARGPDQFR